MQVPGFSLASRFLQFWRLNRVRGATELSPRRKPRVHERSAASVKDKSRSWTAFVSEVTIPTVLIEQSHSLLPSPLRFHHTPNDALEAWKWRTDTALHK